LSGHLKECIDIPLADPFLMVWSYNFWLVNDLSDLAALAKQKAKAYSTLTISIRVVG